MSDEVNLFELIEKNLEPDELDYKDIGKIIEQLRKILLHDIGMKNIMDELLFKKIGRYYTDNDILKEQASLNIIEKELTRIPKWLYNKQINYVKKRRIIEVNGKWDPMSKHDTNYSVHSLILGDLIIMGKNDKNCPFNVDFNGIYNEIKKITPFYWGITTKELEESKIKLKNILSKIKDEQYTLKDIINYYFPNPYCFQKYNWRVLETTGDGDEAEEKFIDLCPKIGFKINSRGFNGSVVDIVFGVDFIVVREIDGKFFTAQIKKDKPSKIDIDDYFDRRFIDIIVWVENDKIVMMNRKRIIKKHDIN